MERSGLSTFGLIRYEVDLVHLALFGTKWAEYIWLGLEGSGLSTFVLIWNEVGLVHLA